MHNGATITITLGLNSWYDGNRQAFVALLSSLVNTQLSDHMLAALRSDASAEVLERSVTVQWEEPK